MVSATDEWRFPAMEFVNDPVIACGERVPFAWRSSAGTAYGWDPATGDLDDLLAFLGEGFVVVNGKLYWDGDGTLFLQTTDKAGAWVRWLTAEPGFVPADGVLHEGCVVRGDVDLAARLADAQAELVEAVREVADRDGRIAELEADLRLNDETQADLAGLSSYLLRATASHEAAVLAGTDGFATGQRVDMSPDLVDEAKIGASAFDPNGLHAEAVASLALDGQTFDVGPVTVLSPDADAVQGTPVIPRPEPKPKGGKSKPAPSSTEG